MTGPADGNTIPAGEDVLAREAPVFTSSLSTSANSSSPSGPEPPYPFIAEELLFGSIVPFLGAGASVFHKGRGVVCPPSGEALAETLANRAGFPREPAFRRRDLARVASYFVEVQIGRKGLRRVLQQQFQEPFPPNALHELLAAVALRTPLLIVTTNYDDMIEVAFDRAGVPYHLVVTAIEDQDWRGTVRHRCPHATTFAEVGPIDLNISLESASIIYKMHGTVDRQKPDGSHYVITEEDYVRFLSGLSPVGECSVPPCLKLELRSRCFLFLGYSLADWNFRVMLDMLGATKARASSEEQRSWAIQFNPDDVEARLWDRKKVNVYNLDLNLFTERLGAELRLAASAMPGART